MRRSGLLGVAVAAVLLATAGPAHAAWRYVNTGGGTSAIWNSCPGVAIGEQCAFTLIDAQMVSADPSSGVTQRNCVFVQQARGTKINDFGIQSFDSTYANACGTPSVHVDGSLGHASVDGTLPARDCHFDLATTTTTCTPTTVTVSVAWTGTGTVISNSSITYRYSYESGQRCLFHATPARQRAAVASGTIGGLPAPMGGLQEADLFYGGVVNVGTDVGCFD
jgi:hypothetical protein